MNTNVYTALQLKAQEQVAAAVERANKAARVNLVLAGGSEPNPGRVHLQLEQVGRLHGVRSTVRTPDHAHYAGDMREAAERLEFDAYRTQLTFSLEGTINGKTIAPNYPLTIYVDADRRSGMITAGPYRWDSLTDSARRIVRALGQDIAVAVDLTSPMVKAILWEQHVLDMRYKLQEAQDALTQMINTATEIHTAALERTDKFFTTK